MDIILVLPRLERGFTTCKDKISWSSIILGYPEITLHHLASITPPKHSVHVINENFEDIPYTQDIDLVGISCFTMSAPRAYQIADKFRRLGKKVVLGGYHPSALPDEALQHSDSVVIGEEKKILFNN